MKQKAKDKANEPLAAKAAAPAAGTGTGGTPPTIRSPVSPLTAVLELARRGNPACLPLLREALDQHPELVAHYGNLARAIERTWVTGIGGDLRIVESVTRRLEALRRELGPKTKLEELIAERVVSSWLQVQQAEMALATSGQEGLKVRQFYLRQLESASRRFHAACRNLALVRRLLGGVELRVRHEHNLTMSVPAPRRRRPTRRRGASRPPGGRPCLAVCRALCWRTPMPDEPQSASTPPPEPAGSAERLAEPTLEQMRRWAEWRIVCQTPEGEQLPLLLGWLKTKHARRNAVAGYLLGRLGPPVVQALVRETFRARRQPSCQLRLLGVMERIAAPLGLDEFLALASLLSVTGDQQVRAAIARILQARHGAGAGDPTPAPGSSPGPAPQAPEESGAAPRPAARR